MDERLFERTASAPRKKALSDKSVVQDIIPTEEARRPAFGIDIFYQGIIILVMIFLFWIISGFEFSSLFVGIWGFSIFWWVVFIHIFYFTAFEWYFGQTPGKMSVKIRVIS